MHTTKRLLRDSFGEYQPLPTRTLDRLRNSGLIRMEGADGDEIANTVTYYYIENEER